MGLVAQQPVTSRRTTFVNEGEQDVMTPTAAPSESPSTPFQFVPIKSITPSPLNPRKYFDPEKLQELAASMGNGVGVIDPLVLRTNGKAHAFEIVAGQRRWKAAQMAGLDEVPAVIKSLTDAQVLKLMLIENDQREDINALERAEGFKRALKFGFDIDKLAGRLGHTRKYIYDHIKLLELIPAAQDLLLDNRITASHAILIARLTPEQQKKAISVKRDYGHLRDSPLFEHEDRLWSPDEREEERAEKKDPLHGLKVRSVRELEAWIAEHCRFDVSAPVNVELFPETHAAVEEAEKVVYITHNHHVQPDAKDGNTQRIYSTVSWKRADGRRKSKTCDRSVTGVIVVGAGRGEAFKVCVHKECDVHWKAERRAKEKAAKQGVPDWKKAQEAREARYRREEAERQHRQAQWKKATPAILEACAVKVKTLPVATMATELLAGNDRADVTRAIALLGGKPKTADDALRTLVLTSLVDECDRAHYDPRDFQRLAKGLLKLDVAALLKKVTMTSQPSQAKAKKAAKGKKR